MQSGRRLELRPAGLAVQLAIAAITLATRNERRALATARVAMPTVLGFLGFAMFAVGIAIYGF